MKKTVVILNILIWLFSSGMAQNSSSDFSWGNAHYFNLNEGESITFNNTDIKLLRLENHFNHIKVGNDTINIEVSRRTLPATVGGLCIFVADNKNVKSISSDSEVHGLLTKDALICISDYDNLLIDPDQYTFPVNFNNGFIWNMEVDGYMFAYMGLDEKYGKNYYRSHEGIDFDLDDARGLEKHWIVAIENSEVMWIEEYEVGGQEAACVMLKSESTPGLFYVYEGFLARSLEMRKGNHVVQGEILGTVWGDENNGFLQLGIVKSDTVPTYQQRFYNSVNFFPQIYQLYYNRIYGFTKNFTKGVIVFGKNNNTSDKNKSNIHLYEDYIGKGWLFDHWNKTQRVECVTGVNESNARFGKILFADSPAASRNPENWYEYKISVSNGVYRIRAKLGDLKLPSWQRVEIEGLDSGTFELAAGEYQWTHERIVKVNDANLIVRIYIDSTNSKVAGLSEIVFQKAY